ncbi:MAG: PIN domain nuclease [Acidimicrobiia bacterium]
MNEYFLVDKSAWEQRRHSQIAADLLARLLSEDRVASCHVSALEIQFSARNAREYLEQVEERTALRWLPVSEVVMDRAMEVQVKLARKGQHRLPIPDLMIAATAEIHGATVLHYDDDFDLIAAVTKQPAQWILPCGTGG